MSEQLKSIEEIRELVKSENNALQPTPNEKTNQIAVPPQHNFNGGNI